MWSEYPNPLVFGRALAETYCQKIETFYPAELTNGRTGYVMPGALDISWDGIHKKRGTAADLVLFLVDPSRRAGQAANYRITANIPPGWLAAPPTAVRRRPEAGASPPTPHVIRKEKIENQRNVKGNGTKQRTGNVKTDEMRSVIVEHKYSNPLLCLTTIDETPNAMEFWLWAVEHRISDLSTLLANMTDTDDAWRKIGNPTVSG